MTNRTKTTTFCTECDSMQAYKIEKPDMAWVCLACGFAIDCVECGQTMDDQHRCVSERCPLTGRSASVCDSADHRNCPDLRKESGRG